jgi:hypothetical protein
MEGRDWSLPAVTAALAAATIPTKPARSALGFGASFVYVERAAIQILPVQGIDRGVRFRIVRHLDKREASRLPGVTIPNYVYVIDASVRLEGRTEGIFGGGEAEITNKNVFHFTLLLSEVADGRIGQDRTLDGANRIVRDDA